MAEGDDDISILTLDDTSDPTIEENLLYGNFAPLPRNSPSPTHKSESFQVLYDAYEKLKVRFNDLYLKSENQAKIIKEMETHSSCSPMSDSSTSGSYLYVGSNGRSQQVGSESNRNSTDLNVLHGQVTELQRKNMILENKNRSMNAENDSLKKMSEVLKRNEEKSRSNVIVLEERLEYLTQRLKQLESIRGSDLTNKIIDLETQCKKLRLENEALSKEVSRLTQEDERLKSKYTGVTESNGSASNGVTSSDAGVVNGMAQSNALLAISSLSLSSTAPTAEELNKLKIIIKNLKTVIVQQHSALIKLQENPAIKKILQDSSNSMSLSTTDLAKQTNALTNGSARMQSPRSSIANHTDRPLSDSISNLEILSQRPRNSSSTLDLVPESQSPERNRLTHQSRSEVIQGRPLMHADLQRSHSLVSRNEAEPVFQRESDPVHPVPHVNNTDYYASCRAETSARENNDSESEKICPVCSTDFSHFTIGEFQTHVFNCVDEQPATLTRSSVSDRICPMCNHTFPSDCPQITVDNHVNAHFGEPAVGDGFEILN